MSASVQGGLDVHSSAGASIEGHQLRAPRFARVGQPLPHLLFAGEVTDPIELRSPVDLPDVDFEELRHALVEVDVAQRLLLAGRRRQETCLDPAAIPCSRPDSSSRRRNPVTSSTNPPPEPKGASSSSKDCRPAKTRPEKSWFRFRVQGTCSRLNLAGYHSHTQKVLMRNLIAGPQSVVPFGRTTNKRGVPYRARLRPRDVSKG